jgi:hypothetical protein
MAGMVDMGIDRSILPQLARTAMLLTFATSCVIEQAYRIIGEAAR